MQQLIIPLIPVYWNIAAYMYAKIYYHQKWHIIMTDVFAETGEDKVSTMRLISFARQIAVGMVSTEIFLGHDSMLGGVWVMYILVWNISSYFMAMTIGFVYEGLP